MPPKADPETKRDTARAKRNAESLRLRSAAADKDQQASSLTHTIAALDGHRARLLIEAYALRQQAKET